MSYCDESLKSGRSHSTAQNHALVTHVGEDESYHVCIPNITLAFYAENKVHAAQSSRLSIICNLNR